MNKKQLFGFIGIYIVVFLSLSFGLLFIFPSWLSPHSFSGKFFQTISFFTPAILEYSDHGCGVLATFPFNPFFPYISLVVSFLLTFIILKFIPRIFEWRKQLILLLLAVIIIGGFNFIVKGILGIQVETEKSYVRKASNGLSLPPLGDCF